MKESHVFKINKSIHNYPNIWWEILCPLISATYLKSEKNKKILTLKSKNKLLVNINFN